MSRSRSISEEDSLDRGFSAGKFDGVFSASYEARRNGPPAYKAAYLIGYFIDAETHEVPTHLRKLLVAAERVYGDKMRKLGIRVRAR